MKSPKEQLIKSIQPLSKDILNIFSSKTGVNFHSIDLAIEYIDTTSQIESFSAFSHVIDAVNLIGLAVESIEEDEPDYDLFTKSIIKAAQAVYIDILGELFHRSFTECFVNSTSTEFNQYKEKLGSNFQRLIAKSGGDAKDIKCGYSAKREKIREAWLSGKYTSRDVCAEQECAAIGMSFSTARKALRNTSNPT